MTLTKEQLDIVNLDYEFFTERMGIYIYEANLPPPHALNKTLKEMRLLFIK